MYEGNIGFRRTETSCEPATKVNFRGMILVSTVVERPRLGSEPTIVNGYAMPLVGSVNEEVQWGTVRGFLVDASPCSEPSWDELLVSSPEPAANAPADGSSADASRARQTSAHDIPRLRDFNWRPLPSSLLRALKPRLGLREE
jgi:hypothetical protein